MFTKDYADVFAGDENWRSLEVAGGTALHLGRHVDVRPQAAVRRRRCRATPARSPTSPVPASLAVLGDSVTTDHISPAGSIRPTSPAGRWLVANGVRPDRVQLLRDPARQPRGDDPRHVRQHPASATRSAGGVEGGVTVHLPDGDARLDLRRRRRATAAEGVPLIVLAGKEYGSGSSRDWAAKGSPSSACAPSSSRASSGSTARTSSAWASSPSSSSRARTPRRIGLTGTEVFDVTGLAGAARGGLLRRHVTVHADDKAFEAVVRIDTPTEEDYFRHGGILPYVARKLLGSLTARQRGPAGGRCPSLVSDASRQPRPMPRRPRRAGTRGSPAGASARTLPAIALIRA